MTGPDPRPFGVRVGLFAALTLACLWPAVWAGGPGLFFDSPAYYNGGGRALEILEQKLAPAAPSPAAPGAATPGAATPSPATPGAATPGPSKPLTSLRSLPFSLFMNVSIRGLGLFAPIAALSAVLAWLVIAFTAALPPARQAAVALGTVVLTTLPFYTSQLMPDALAGALLVVPMLLAVRPDLGRWTVALLLVVFYLSVISHYAHVPVAAVMTLGLVALCLGRRRYLRAGVVLLPLVLALATNLAVSALTPGGGGPSLAPGRLPILLARTLADGPGRAFLESTCPDARFTLCEVYSTFPANAHDALWGDDAIYERATSAQARRIAAEEVPLVLAVFRAYPVAQTRALVGNAVRQFFLVGLADHSFGAITLEGPTKMTIDQRHAEGRGIKTAVELVQLVAIAAAVAALALFWRRLPPGYGAATAFLAAGLVTNAAICGGLSAPVDRYQGRIVWCVVLLGFQAAAVATARVRAPRAAATGSSARDGLRATAFETLRRERR